ncbi:unnamed protein product, partial [Pylaiella littoralis]
MVAFKAAGEKFGCHWETIKRLWRRYETQHKAGVASPQLANRRKANSGRKGWFLCANPVPAGPSQTQDHRRPHRRGRDRMGDGVAGQARQCVDFAPGLHGANLALRWGEHLQVASLGQGQGCTGGGADSPAVPDLRGGVDQGLSGARGGR